MKGDLPPEPRTQDSLPAGCRVRRLQQKRGNEGKASTGDEFPSLEGGDWWEVNGAEVGTQ